MAAFLLGLPTKVGLAIAAGYGWYSLTGILLTNAYGPVIGSTAFFNDLMRELAAIMLIPIIINQFRSTALGFVGQHRWTLRYLYCNAAAGCLLYLPPLSTVLY